MTSFPYTCLCCGEVFDMQYSKKQKILKNSNLKKTRIECPRCGHVYLAEVNINQRHMQQWVVTDCPHAQHHYNIGGIVVGVPV